MEIKNCGRCKQVKPTSEFNKGRGGFNFYCKICANELARENYRQNKDRYFQKAKDRDVELDRLVFEAKNKPCTDCGVKYPPYVMDLDHLDPETKKFDVSAMRRRRMAFSKIILEIAKCEVVCANCHRIRTNMRNPSRYTKAMMYGNF